MVEQRIPSIMREAFGALGKGDVEKSLSFFADDATWVTPNGTFKGKAELRRYLTWMAQTTKDMTIKECGIGIMVQGNKAFVEHMIGGTMEGKRGEVLAMCAWEFSGDKVQSMRAVMDRLSLAQQAAKGCPARWLVNLIVRRAEKGLR